MPGYGRPIVTAVDDGVTPALPGEILPHLTPPSQIDGMSVVSFRASRQMVFFTGAVVQNDLLKLAEAVGEPLYRGLAATESAGARPRSRSSAVEDLYALVIRPEDGETWGPIPWMDDKWIAENSVEMEEVS